MHGGVVFGEDPIFLWRRTHRTAERSPASKGIRRAASFGLQRCDVRAIRDEPLNDAGLIGYAWRQYDVFQEVPNRILLSSLHSSIDLKYGIGSGPGGGECMRTLSVACVVGDGHYGSNLLLNAVPSKTLADIVVVVNSLGRGWNEKHLTYQVIARVSLCSGLSLMLDAGVVTRLERLLQSGRWKLPIPKL